MFNFLENYTDSFKLVDSRETTFFFVLKVSSILLCFSKNILNTALFRPHSSACMCLETAAGRLQPASSASLCCLCMKYMEAFIRGLVSLLVPEFPTTNRKES